MWIRCAHPHRLAGRPLGGESHMRQELEAIVGAAALDERAVRDLWPLAIMDERAGKSAPRVLVARPAGREQISTILRWAAANSVTVTPLGGAAGGCGAGGPAKGGALMQHAA